MLIERCLAAPFTLRRAVSLQMAMETVQAEAFDLVILDLTLDDSRGYETFEKAQKAISGTPILILSGLDDDDLAIRAVANGAQDYVRKSRLLDYPLDRAARYAIQRHRAEAAVRHSEALARSITDSLAARILVLDENADILFANADWISSVRERGVAVSKTGIGANYLQICSNWTHTNPPVEVAHQIAQGLQAVLRGHKLTFNLDFPYELRGEPAWMALKILPVTGAGPRRFLVTQTDITAQRAAERLASEQCSLRQAVAGMEQFLGVVGHELRTPLAAVRAITEFLTADGAQSGTEARALLHQISSEVQHMSNTMNNLLEAARLSSGHANWNWSEIDLKSIAEEAAAASRFLVDQNKVQIRCNVDSTAQRMLGDSEAVSRLLGNLLSNALKHTPAGQIDISVLRRIEPGNAWIEIAVADTGCGISPELSNRLGEAFALNSGSVGQNHITGAGLGLSICKGIAAAHGGDLMIQSTTGKGTTVKARLRADLRAPAQGFAALASVDHSLAA
jgi:signal transduction histidine kinase